MSDRFPYDLPSREALVKLAAETTKEDITSNFVSFDDMFFSPLQTIPGRTFIEMTNRKTGHKFWYMFRRLDLALVFGKTAIFKVVGPATPASIAAEINRSRNMVLGPDDLSFSQVTIPQRTNPFVYRLRAMTGSYAYYGEVDVLIEILDGGFGARLLEDGDLRLMEDGQIRQLQEG